MNNIESIPNIPEKFYNDEQEMINERKNTNKSLQDEDNLYENDYKQNNRKETNMILRRKKTFQTEKTRKIQYKRMQWDRLLFKRKRRYCQRAGRSPGNWCK